MEVEFEISSKIKRAATLFVHLWRAAIDDVDFKKKNTKQYDDVDFKKKKYKAICSSLACGYRARPGHRRAAKQLTTSIRS
jgi:hypothetical protein